MTSPLFPDVIVNGEIIPHKMVAAEAQHHIGPRGKPGIAWRKAAKAVAIRTLLLQQARAQKIEAHPEEVAPGQIETEEEALIRGLLRTAIDTPHPSEAEIRAEWERGPERFRSPPLWEVSHILIACDPRSDTARKQALARATKLTGLARDERNGFAVLAARESDCGSKTSGGSLGQLGPGDTVPEFEAVFRNLNEGEVAETPVLTRHGYHVIRMDAVAEGQILPFGAVREKISDALEKTAWARQAQSFVGQLVAAADIKGADLSVV
ncbi:peptidylprolyl isomerase [uncultured Roseobacter sp.]|uniref:peptidylprolyl isomerase n=1 Tax=uncultured Roseobacter sp. TaxID=114847 RepID=UPI00262F042F|nr:peptidylprolyl isomerase [uncultured Roseobacter sp.]